MNIFYDDDNLIKSFEIFKLLLIEGVSLPSAEEIVVPVLVNNNIILYNEKKKTIL